MTWFVASLRDQDTHFGGDLTNGTVTALCGYSFRPLATLKGSPPDPLQVCPTCAKLGRAGVTSVDPRILAQPVTTRPPHRPSPQSSPALPANAPDTRTLEP